MRALYLLLFYTLGLGFLLSARASAQTPWRIYEQDFLQESVHRHDVLVPISKYMSKGDAERLAAWFDDNLEISIFSNSCAASKAQATHILRHFFKEHNPHSFRVTHSAERRNMKHALGQLKTSSESFIVTIFVSSEDDNYKIQQLKIERQ